MWILSVENIPTRIIEATSPFSGCRVHPPWIIYCVNYLRFPISHPKDIQDTEKSKYGSPCSICIRLNRPESVEARGCVTWLWRGKCPGHPSGGRGWGGLSQWVRHMMGNLNIYWISNFIIWMWCVGISEGKIPCCDWYKLNHLDVTEMEFLSKDSQDVCSLSELVQPWWPWEMLGQAIKIAIQSSIWITAPSRCNHGV